MILGVKRSWKSPENLFLKKGMNPVVYLFRVIYLAL